MKALQKFSDEYLEVCKTMRPDQIIKFLEEFRQIHGEKPSIGGSQLISMKVPKSLLQTFKTKCRLLDTPYQTQIKRLMVGWLRNGSPPERV